MGCTSGKSLRKFNGAKLQNIDQMEVVNRILETVDELEQVKQESISFNKNIPSKYNGLPLDQFLVKAYQKNFYTKEVLQQLYNRVNRIFTKADALLNQVQALLMAHDQKKMSIKGEVYDIFAEFVQLFQQVTQDILKMPNICFDDFSHYDIQKRITDILSESILDSEISV